MPKETLWTPEDTPAKEFAAQVTPSLKLAFGEAGKKAGLDQGVSIDWDFLDPEARAYAASRGAELVGMKWQNGKLIPNPAAGWAIDVTTRDAVREMLVDALTEGWSFQEFSSRLVESGLFSDARADLIARTEMATAMNAGRVKTYEKLGFEYVVVSDEAECGQDICNVDGEVWTLEEAAAEPLGHPNCTRSFRPATREEAAEERGEELEDEAA